jgi:hypothetical protein
MSIPWSPPEMFEDDPRPDPRSDVFSLSATIWTLLAGRTPFELPGGSNQSIDLMTRIERGAITPLERPDVPRSLVAVLRKGMSVDSRDRYATAVDFARAMQSVELELSYAPTPLDVPGLAVASVDHVDEGGEATRIRGVTSIPAQRSEVRRPAPPPTTAQPDPNPGDSAPAATVIRRPVLEQTVRRSPEEAVADHEPAEARPSRSRRLVIGAAIAVVVVLGGVGAAIALNPPGDAPEDDPGDVAEADPGGVDDPIVASTVPTPVLESVGPGVDVDSVVFTWTNPSPVDGDGYVWQRTDGAGDDQRRPTSEGTATVADIAAGTTVCIDVYIRRSGELSPEPLSACFP